MTAERITTFEAERADALREPVSLDKYQQDVAKALTRVFEDDATTEQELDLDTARLVILSDVHKGARDGADDFLRCERAYNAALAYYFETGYRLFVLGDAEELWECSAEEVLEKYQETLKLESEFHAARRYERFWGNHDDQWRADGEVSKHLAQLFPGLEVREALKLHVTREGERLGTLFFVHGHQGTANSDRFSWFSRVVVRHVWRPLQRRLDMPSTTPSRDWELRQRHDTAMFTWARTQPARPVLIAGHTHRPVFWTSKAPGAKESEGELQRRLDELRASGAEPEELGRLRAKLECVKAERRRQGPQPMTIDPPCYFNSGCSSFGDGDVTAIEIADGDIRLVRWPDDDDEPLPKLLVEAELAEVFDRVAGKALPRPPAAEVPREEPVTARSLPGGR